MGSKNKVNKITRSQEQDDVFKLMDKEVKKNPNAHLR